MCSTKLAFHIAEVPSGSRRRTLGKVGDSSIRCNRIGVSIHGINLFTSSAHRPTSAGRCAEAFRSLKVETDNGHKMNDPMIKLYVSHDRPDISLGRV